MGNRFCYIFRIVFVICVSVVFFKPKCFASNAIQCSDIFVTITVFDARNILLKSKSTSEVNNHSDIVGISDVSVRDVGNQTFDTTTSDIPTISPTPPLDTEIKSEKNDESWKLRLALAELIYYKRESFTDPTVLNLFAEVVDGKADPDNDSRFDKYGQYFVELISESAVVQRLIFEQLSSTYNWNSQHYASDFLQSSQAKKGFVKSILHFISNLFRGKVIELKFISIFNREFKKVAVEKRLEVLKKSVNKKFPAISHEEAFSIIHLIADDGEKIDAFVILKPKIFTHISMYSEAEIDNFLYTKGISTNVVQEIKTLANNENYEQKKITPKKQKQKQKVSERTRQVINMADATTNADQHISVIMDYLMIYKSTLSVKDVLALAQSCPTASSTNKVLLVFTYAEYDMDIYPRSVDDYKRLADKACTMDTSDEILIFAAETLKDLGYNDYKTLASSACTHAGTNKILKIGSKKLHNVVKTSSTP